MAIDYETLLNRKFDDEEADYDFTSTILYALGLNVGHDPLDLDQLRYVYEENLAALPTMAVVLAGPGFWVQDPSTGVDWVKLLHGEQGVTIHKPIPAEGSVVGQTRVTEIVDKGEGRGALLLSEKKLFNKKTGDLLATCHSTAFCRGDGGFGGPARKAPVPHEIPNREPDKTVDWPTLPQSALIYRLSGDYNPLHADPKIANAANFPKPILHGLCSYGIAQLGVMRAYCGFDGDKINDFKLRFTAPVFPGETIQVEMWRDGNTVSFRARSKERGVIVMSNGRALLVD